MIFWQTEQMMLDCFRPKKDREAENEKALSINGRKLLERSITFTNGRGNPIRCFSAKELSNASNHYNETQVYWDDGCSILYNGSLEDRRIVLKKYPENRKFPHFNIRDVLEKTMSEIVLASQMSSHKNTLKLLGCCLETQIPILVFESAENGTLHDRIYNPHELKLLPLPWKNRVKIALGAANAIAYLHTAFKRPVIHKDIRLSNILLDEDYNPKLTDFSMSEMIPEDKTHVEHKVLRENVPEQVLGYLAPELFSTGIINEKFDVYSFGVVLLSLLTAKAAGNPENYFMVQGARKFMATEGSNKNVVDPFILEEVREQELQSFTTLAVQCTSDLEDDRPSIIQVAKQLLAIYQSVFSNFCC